MQHKGQYCFTPVEHSWRERVTEALGLATNNHNIWSFVSTPPSFCEYVGGKLQAAHCYYSKCTEAPWWRGWGTFGTLKDPYIYFTAQNHPVHSGVLISWQRLAHLLQILQYIEEEHPLIVQYVLHDTIRVFGCWVKADPLGFAKYKRINSQRLDRCDSPAKLWAKQVWSSLYIAYI